MPWISQTLGCPNCSQPHTVYVDSRDYPVVVSNWKHTRLVFDCPTTRLVTEIENQFAWDEVINIPEGASRARIEE